MKKVFYVIADVSGSMKEMGKTPLLRNLLRFISELQVINEDKYTEFEFNFFSWSSSLSEIVFQNNEEQFAIEPKGKADLDQLKVRLESILDNDSPLKVLIVSDGNFSTTDIDNFNKWRKEQSNLMIRTVGVGADADHFKLEKLSTNSKMSKSENISSAIDSLLFGTDIQIGCPDSISQISMPTEPQEDWDD